MESAALLLVAALVAQVPISILVYLDARRLELENSSMYYYGIVVPLAGFLVVAVYLSKRTELPRENAGDG
ncbi:hypothetical protein RBH26_06235 [Natronolimnohabitans sp. A-GB9]|uniref:hypothetical protein n=1 Tax=Natronolimnohabitans sp. A-GB9 TaxID=3069757 RepID=UPI0027AF66DE|nr:hypothetical protein [Natronolimnohabitans sp. A-GB9]MDQ2050079.1 hypothetical protein [Natronolimnohabitans sp. A-GB9]